MQNQQAKGESPKQWMWNPEEQFQVDGKSVEILINLVQSILQDPSSAKVMWAIEADKVLSQVMNKGIQDGIIKDKTEFERLKNAEIVDSSSDIMTDLNHYKNMSDEELQVSLGVTRNRYKDKPRKENILKYDLAPSTPKPILDGKYWIPESEYKILENFKGQRINFYYSNNLEGYTFHVNKY